MATALEGVTIIDLTHMLSGPYAGMILADLGAETIKVEPLAGEGTRKLLQSDPEYSLGDQGAYFITLNRNKKSVAIDLKSSQGLEVFYDMVRKADVVLDNFAADVTTKLKIDYAQLSKINPNIITCSISGFGSDGPQYRRTAFDQVVQALGGGMSITGLDKDTPMRAGIPIGDLGGGMFAVMGVLAALRERDQKGVGQHVDISMLDAQISLLNYMATMHFMSGKNPEPIGNSHFVHVPYNSFKTANGHIIIAVIFDKFWDALVDVLDVPEFRNEKMDAGFADMTASFSYNDLEEYLLSDGTAATFYGYEVTPACLADRASLNSFTSDFFGPAFQPFGVLPPSGSGAGYDPFADDANFAGVYGPYTPLSCDGYQYQERNQTDMSIDVRFTSKEDSDVRWIAGFYLAEIEREVVVAYGADTGAGFLRQPYVPATGPNPTDLLFWDDFDTSVASVYGQVEFDINDTMELAFALRYDYESRDVNNKVPNVPGSGLNVNLLDGNFQALPINAALVSNPNGIPSRSESFSQLQPKVTWSWQASDEINVYASYGVGFRSGGFNSVGTEDTLNFWFNAGYGGPGEAVGAGISVPDAYDKEVSTNIELGAKGEFMDRRLRVNAALFRTNVDDNQFFEFFAGPFGLLRSVTTIDELYIEGFEADVNFVLNEEISLFGGIGLMSSEIEANRHRPLSVGNDVPQAPEKTATLGAQYVKQLGEGLELGVRADWQYTGAMWFHTLQGEESPTIWNAFFGPGFNSDFLDPATGSNAQRDAYDTLNLRISLSSEQWSVTAWGKNITDELYLQEVIPAPEFGGTFNHPSAQAAYGVDFTYRF